MTKTKISSILYLLAGFLFLLSALFDNFKATIVALGILFTMLGVTKLIRKG
ncbi:hypothetical protein FD46_GL001067 [Liquorilactobacillus oeni DSM 19972]|uniref:Uncharacterized protein n=1 Tax=Liquorilactobacillus oeni DSM 19972 TaxID=1423777 RepID=A0A0R1MB40_9LACO|nr:hypothetical protein FD46_GL001067 [Liquorilactobacillus oeni DSM 19972]